VAALLPTPGVNGNRVMKAWADGGSAMEMRRKPAMFDINDKHRRGIKLSAVISSQLGGSGEINGWRQRRMQPHHLKPQLNQHGVMAA